MAADRLPITPSVAREWPPTISVEEAAELVGIGRNAAYRSAATGELPAIRIGRRLRVPTARLLELLGLRDAEPQDVA